MDTMRNSPLTSNNRLSVCCATVSFTIVAVIFVTGFTFWAKDVTQKPDGYDDSPIESDVKAVLNYNGNYDQNTCYYDKCYFVNGTSGAQCMLRASFYKNTYHVNDTIKYYLRSYGTCIEPFHQEGINDTYDRDLKFFIIVASILGALFLVCICSILGCCYFSNKQ